MLTNSGNNLLKPSGILKLLFTLLKIFVASSFLPKRILQPANLNSIAD